MPGLAYVGHGSPAAAEAAVPNTFGGDYSGCRSVEIVEMNTKPLVASGHQHVAGFRCAVTPHDGRCVPLWEVRRVRS